MKEYTQDPTDENQSKVASYSSFRFSSLGWLFVLLFVPQIIFSFIVAVTLAINGFDEYGSKNPQTEIMISVWAIILSPLLFYPLLKYVTNAKSVAALTEYFELKKTKLLHVLLIIFGIISFELTIDFMFALLGIPIEAFMLEIQKFSNTFEHLTLVFLSFCLIAPIIEELVFRGWLFQEVANTRFGGWGAVGLTSFVFSLVHFQYQELSTFIFLVVYAVILGTLRLKTNNLFYPIVAHITSNTLAIFMLTWFA